MSWNYRIMKHEVREQVYYAIHEVYYDTDGKLGYTAAPIDLTGDNLAELESSYKMIGEAFNKPILNYE